MIRTTALAALLVSTALCTSAMAQTPTPPNPPLADSAYWGDEAIWTSQANIHNPMFDGQGRVWFTHTIRPRETAKFCQAGSTHPSAKAFPTTAAGRSLSVILIGKPDGGIRPIALYRAAYRVLSRIKLNRLQRWVVTITGPQIHTIKGRHVSDVARRMVATY